METHREWLIYMRAHKEHTCLMRKQFWLAVLCLFVPIFAFAGELSRVAPSTWYVGATEEYLNLGGTALRGTVSTLVVFDGPAGTFTIEAQPGDSPDFLESWIPAPVLTNTGTYSVTVRAVDAAGERVMGPLPMEVIERPVEQPPLLSIPESINAEATSRDGAIVSFTTSAKGFGATAPTLQCNHQSGDQFPLGSTTVSCSASDGFGNAEGSFTVTVTDSVKPTMTLPADITTTNTVVTFDVTATDAIDGDLIPVCSPHSGSTFPTGTTTVRCTATDLDANSVTGTFTVTITIAGAGVPALTLPGNLTVEATNPLGAIVLYIATATDPEDGNVPVSCIPESGSMFAIGTETVLCSATDLQGHRTEGSFLVTVRDTTPPVVGPITASVPAIWPPDHKMIAETFTVIAHDLVDPNPLSHIISITSNQPVNGNGDGNTAPDFQITGALTANLRAERASGNDRIYTITFATVDASGNLTTSTCEVRVMQQPASQLRTTIR